MNASDLASAQTAAPSYSWRGGPLSVAQIAVLIFFGISALAISVPAFSLAGWMLGHDFYQHTPLLVVAGIGLAIYRLRNNKIAFEGEITVRLVLQSFLLTLTIGAIFVMPSRWAASLAGLLLVIALINFYGGRRLAALMFGPVLLLATAIPIPAGFDNWFVVSLQNLATYLASIWLDLVGIMHYATGVSIQTATHDYYVKDACSGIHSIFAAIAVGVGYGVMRHYRFWRIVLFLIQLVFWVVIANSLRVFLTVWGQTRFDLDLSGDVFHEFIGMAAIPGEG